MKFNVFLTIKGPGNTVEIPANTNPIECANLASLLQMLTLPKSEFVETIGIRVMPIEDCP